MNIQPIKTERDYKQALQAVENLWGAKENTSDGDRLDILITLVDAYEQVNHPIFPRVDLEEFIGTRARVSEILNGKRDLSIEMIRSLHDGLGVPLESLIARPRTSRAS